MSVFVLAASLGYPLQFRDVTELEQRTTVGQTTASLLHITPFILQKHKVIVMHNDKVMTQISVKKKKVNFSLEHAMKAQRGKIALLFL